MKRLAVHVEDHPTEYGEFEGNIPPDNYGAGPVIVWDHGTYRSTKPEALLAQLERGLIEIEFLGFKLRGRWTLARMARQERNWLLIRRAGEPVPHEELTDRHPRSVVSGLTVDEMRDPEAVRRALRARIEGLDAPRREVAGRTQPFMLATPAEHPPEGRSWLFEVKYDGVRVLAERRGDKVFWPAEGYTKGDLIAYYDAVAPYLLPYLRDRPIVLTRYPDGITGKSFFQKDAPQYGHAWVRTERTYSKDADREIDYFVVDDADMLRYVVNLGTIPIHLWSARVPSLERPNWLVLDLDPKGAPFTDVVRVARTLHAILDDLELPAFVKTSGATGLHLLVPLHAGYTHEQSRTFARLVALLGVQALPDITTIARPLGARGGRVYIDFGQNGHGRTIVAPYSVRPLPGAPISCPLDWAEVTARLDPSRFTIRTAIRRFAARRDPLTPVLGPGIDMASAIARMEARGGPGTARRG